MNPVVECIWRTAFKVIYGWGFNVRVEGREKFPMEGPLIVAPNHLSNNDPPVIGYALPRAVHFMAKEELFRNPFLRTVIQWLGAFPVRRGGVDKIAIRHAMNLLKKRWVLGIFPEGSRQKPGKLGRFHDGVASMALRTAVPVVPVAVIGTREMKRGKIAIIIGDVIEVEKAKPTQEAIDALNAKVKESIETIIADYHARTDS